MRPPRTIAVIGAGAWGTALANAAARDGRRVLLWARNPADAEAMQAQRENVRRLSGVPLRESVAPVSDLRTVADAAALLLATPAQATRQIARALVGIAPPAAPLVVTAKGIERGTGAFPTEIVAAALPGRPVAILSGPSFAADVASGLPTAVVLASTDRGVARELAEALTGPTFRCYHGDDVKGVEIGGAAKNVLAIAAGIVAGRGLGESAKAALIARGFAELMRFARALDARPETLMGLSGLGDLVLTCGSSRSRNFSFGEALGRGFPPAEAARIALAEGAFTADILAELAVRHGVEMPVVAAVSGVLAGRLSIDAAAAALMARPVKDES